MATEKQSEYQEQDQSQSTPPNSGDLLVYPFSEIDGEWNVSDEQLALGASGQGQE